jgi:hypothetical protein
MQIVDKINLLLSEPDYATSDIHSDPGLWDGAGIFTLYAFISALGPTFRMIFESGKLFIGIVFFFGNFFLSFILWLLIALCFRLGAWMVGGQGNYIDALRYVGLAAAPMLFTAILAMLVSLVDPLFSADDKPIILVANFLIMLTGNAWGIPGILCFYGLKNGELLEPVPAALLTFVVFFCVVGIEVYYMGLI